MIADICVVRVVCDQCRASTEYAAPTWSECRVAAQGENWHIEIYHSEYLCYCPACRGHRQPPPGSRWADSQAGLLLTDQAAEARSIARENVTMAARRELIAELTDLRRQLAEARAQPAQSVRIVERRRPGPLVDPDDFDYQPSAGTADAEDYPLSPERLARMEAYIQHEPPTE